LGSAPGNAQAGDYQEAEAPLNGAPFFEKAYFFQTLILTKSGLDNNGQAFDPLPKLLKTAYPHSLSEILCLAMRLVVSSGGLLESRKAHSQQKKH
jgi:hypothetical protein